ESNDLGNCSIAVRIVTGVAEARQPALPVRRQQPQRIPAFGAPRMRDLTALEDHVIDGAVRQAPAHGQAGVPRPDDHCGDGRNGSHSSNDLRNEGRENPSDAGLGSRQSRCAPSAFSALYSTFTVTLVGLVTMS